LKYLSSTKPGERYTGVEVRKEGTIPKKEITKDSKGLKGRRERSVKLVIEKKRGDSVSNGM